MLLWSLCPGEYAVEPVQPSKEGRVAEEDTPSTGPMLHIWVNSDMAVEAVRQSMHNFVTAPMGQDWFLSLMKVCAQSLWLLTSLAPRLIS